MLMRMGQGLTIQASAAQASPVRAQSARPTRRASMAFMEMLQGARDPPVSTQQTWAEVSLQLQGDPRYEAVAEEQRVQMYETFLEALAKVEASKLQRRTERAAADFKVWPFIECPLSSACTGDHAQHLNASLASSDCSTGLQIRLFTRQRAKWSACKFKSDLSVGAAAGAGDSGKHRMAPGAEAAERCWLRGVRRSGAEGAAAPVPGGLRRAQRGAGLQGAAGSQLWHHRQHQLAPRQAAGMRPNCPPPKVLKPLMASPWDFQGHHKSSRPLAATSFSGEE